MPTCGLVAGMQIVWTNPPTDARYVTDRAWESATLDSCPLHEDGRCGLQRLGSYPRVWPAGARVARFWCPLAGTSISLLPDFLAARFSGALDEVEAVVDAVERAGGVAQAIEAVHPAAADGALSLPSAQRSIERRVRPIRAVLRACVTLLPDLAGCAPSLADVRRRLGVERVLTSLRRCLARHLGTYLAPFGFRARGTA